ncbi:MAG: response regulator transcription factor [Chitinophagaceae bacterium]|nr:response regulator transcription factor [Chitinophagaceae bacterium]
MQANTGEIKKPIRILIADDHDLIREGYSALLGGQPEYHFVGAAKDGKELLEMIPVLRPDIIITDIKMPEMDGIEATKIITQKYPSIPIIAFTVFGEESLVLKMLQAGARGYLLKSTPKEELMEAIQALKAGNLYFSNETTGMLAKLIANSNLIMKDQDSEIDFTPNDKAIIRYICEEMLNKEIAQQLGISLKSVENSRDKICRKIGAKNTAGIVIYAIRNGIYKLCFLGILFSIEISPY